MEGYKKEDIYNLDEAARVFWQALPDKFFGEKGKNCKGGKKYEHRVTMALQANVVGSKEDPIVIWKSESQMFSQHSQEQSASAV